MNLIIDKREALEEIYTRRFLDKISRIDRVWKIRDNDIRFRMSAW